MAVGYGDLLPGEEGAARILVREYVDSLGIDLSFQSIEAELAGLPGAYAAPGGAFLVAKEEGRLCGCVGLRRLDDACCEMKRLFVRGPWKGRGVGRELVRLLLVRAKELGYRKMRLDTLPTMKPAQALYASQGFREIGAYVHNPIAGTRYMEKDLEEG